MSGDKKKSLKASFLFLASDHFDMILNAHLGDHSQIRHGPITPIWENFGGALSDELPAPSMVFSKFNGFKEVSRNRSYPIGHPPPPHNLHRLPSSRNKLANGG